MSVPLEDLKVVEVNWTWAVAMPILMAVLENGTEEGRRDARRELMSLARKVDGLNETLQA